MHDRARTIVDLSSRLDVRALGRALDLAQRRRLLRLADVHRCMRRLGPAPGRSPKTIEAVLGQRWPGYDPGESDLETRVLRLVVVAGLPIPRQQYGVRTQGRSFRLDLAYPEQMIAIELDGWEYHRTRVAFDDDRVRDNLLRLAGWSVHHFTSSMSDDFIVTTIAAAVGLATVGSIERV
jgi:very-short-patch-repair endonuclease